MSDLLDTVRELKTRAKNRRDMERYERAIPFLERAIAMIREELDKTRVKAWRAELASELADCYGMMGGIYRRWGLASEDELRRRYLSESVKAYDEGYTFESAPDYGIANSYNLVNRLVGRLLCDPATLSGPASADDSGEFEPLDVPEELERAEKVLQEQIRIERRGDIWAHADLALVTLLLDRADPVSAYSAFRAESPPDYAYESALSALEPLVDSELPEPAAAKLRSAKELLERYRG